MPFNALPSVVLTVISARPRFSESHSRPALGSFSGTSLTQALQDVLGSPAGAALVLEAPSSSQSCRPGAAGCTGRPPFGSHAEAV